MKAHKNREELNEFVSDFNLKDKNSNIRFTADTELKTNKNNLTISLEVMVRYDGFNSSGELTLLDTQGKIDTDKFPEIFKLDFQDFEYKNKSVLQITGKHPTIGAYKILIQPN